MKDFSAALKQEQVIKKHLNFICVYGISKFDAEMFQDLSRTVYLFRQLTQSEVYCGFVIALKKANEKFTYSEESADYFSNKITSSMSADTYTSKKVMAVLVNANRFRAEFASTVNMLNHIYLLKALIDKHNRPRDHFITLKLIEQYTLSAGALILLFLRFLTTFYELYRINNEYEYDKKLHKHKYMLLMDLFMLPINLVNLIFVALRQNDFLPIIGIISFVFEMGIGFIRYQEICAKHLQHITNLASSLKDETFLKHYHACQNYLAKMTLLERRLQDDDVSLADKSIYLTLLIEEQKTELELKKIRYNSLVCSLVVSIFVIFEQMIFQKYLMSSLNPQIALIVTISIVYCCYLLKSLVVDAWVPYSLKQGNDVGDKHIVHGSIGDRNLCLEKNNLSIVSILFKTIAPLLGIVFLNFFSLEITIYLMLALCLFQTVISDSLKDQQEFVGESGDEILVHEIDGCHSGTHETQVSPNLCAT